LKICRFEDNRVGIVRDNQVFDVSEIGGQLPSCRWPYPLGDQFIEQLEVLRPSMERLADNAQGRPAAGVAILSPVANPGKIIGTPTNYHDHIAEVKNDPTLASAHQIRTLHEAEMFLKATSALVGPSQGIAQRFLERRNDPEVELAVVNGKVGTNISREHAVDYVAGYTIGIDMTVRGPEFQCFRKSVDSYAVLGPWLVTKNEVPDPGDLALRLWVNDELRQDGSTHDMIVDVPDLIAYTTSFYTVHPGDVIITRDTRRHRPSSSGGSNSRLDRAYWRDDGECARGLSQ
jgi:2,4-didehydro-3-deoxy-L-rhamnonate hydrolase